MENTVISCYLNAKSNIGIKYITIDTRAHEKKLQRFHYIGNCI